MSEKSIGRRNNDDLNKVLNSKVSNYRGQVVIRFPWGRKRGMSLGRIMFLGNGVRDDGEGKKVIRHEYGHFLEYQQLGFMKYIVGIGIPSLVNNIRKTRPYFNQPWEVNADMLAGIHRPDEHTEEGIRQGKLYFEHLKSNGFFSIVRNVRDFTNHNLSALNGDVNI